MAVSFRPAVRFSPLPPPSVGGTPPVIPSTGRSFAPSRALPSARVSGNGTFRFPAAGGIGRFRAPLLDIDLKLGTFLDQVETETPTAISQREFEITFPRRGATVNVTI